MSRQVGLKNQVNPDRSPLTLERAVKIMKDAFTSATERDIYTGDYVEIYIMTRTGVEVVRHDLRKD